MRALIQRVKEARVEVSGKTVGSAGKGLLIFLGVCRGDSDKDLDYMVKKVSGLRIFEDADGKMNLSVKDVGGEALVVSQFTLCADTRKGNRPSFQDAEEPDKAKKTYLEFIEKMKASGVRVASGEFAASMDVHLVNDGPVTIMLESR